MRQLSRWNFNGIKGRRVAYRRACHSGRKSMKKMLVAFLVLPLAQTAASAQIVGDAAAGKAYWDRQGPELPGRKECQKPKGEGGFGPDLAGRGWSAAQVLRAVRQPWGIMPAFVESQVSAKDAADIAAYMATLPKRDAPD